jgi:hypothetical protein
MNLRTTTKTMTFAEPFSISEGGEIFAAGDYLIRTDEEMIDGLSFLAWRRVAVTIEVRRDGAMQVHHIDPKRLALLISQGGAVTSVA